jgi:hypothetical protein
VLDYRHHDGANQLGDEPDRTTPDPTKSYSDWTGYTPVNTWDQLTDPYRWQPLCVPLPPPGGATSCPGPSSGPPPPHWNRVTPFALTRPDQFGPPTMDRSRLPARPRR